MLVYEHASGSEFLCESPILNSFSLGTNLFIIAAGLSLIFGVLRVIHFAHGPPSRRYRHRTYKRLNERN